MSDSGAQVAIVEQAFLPVILEARENLPGLEHVIVVDGEAPDGVLALDEVEARRSGLRWGRRLRRR